MLITTFIVIDSLQLFLSDQMIFLTHMNFKLLSNINIVGSET